MLCVRTRCQHVQLCTQLGVDRVKAEHALIHMMDERTESTLHTNINDAIGSGVSGTARS
jgi:hypothetical protein